MRPIVFCVCVILLSGSINAVKLPNFSLDENAEIFKQISSIFAAKSHIEPFILEDVINATIEELRPLLPDPLKLDDLNITFPEELDIIKGYADVSNFDLRGLQEFQLQSLSLNVWGLELDFTFVLPTINLNSDYVADLLLLELIPLYGGGPANIHLNNIRIDGTGHADITNGISVNGVRVTLSIDSAVFDIHGALDNEEFSAILSQLLNDVVVSFIDNHEELISNILSPIVEAVINLILGGGSGDATTTEAPTTVGLI